MGLIKEFSQRIVRQESCGKKKINMFGFGIATFLFFLTFKTEENTDWRSIPRSCQ